jgi:hypothetical protein
MKIKAAIGSNVHGWEQYVPLSESVKPPKRRCKCWMVWCDDSLPIYPTVSHTKKDAESKFLDGRKRAMPPNYKARKTILELPHQKSNPKQVR